MDWRAMAYCLWQISNRILCHCGYRNCYQFDRVLHRHRLHVRQTKSSWNALLCLSPTWSDNSQRSFNRHTDYSASHSIKWWALQRWLAFALRKLSYFDFHPESMGVCLLVPKGGFADAIHSRTRWEWRASRKVRKANPVHTQDAKLLICDWLNCLHIN